MTLAISTAPANAMAIKTVKITDHILIPLDGCKLTLEALLDRIAELKEQYPDDEIIMDGDSRAIVRRCRA